MQKDIKEYNLKITNSIVDINLPRKITNISSIRIKQIRYKTASNNNEIMYIIIRDFTNKIYYDGSTNVIFYTKCIPLPNTTNTLIFNENNEFNDVCNIVPKDINILSLEVMINGLYSVDISPNNPLYLELVFS